MKNYQPIYTEKNNCQDCYKCVRWCPVKSIKVEKDSASVIDEDCIHCGRCTLICPVGAKQIRNDLQQAQQLIKSNKKVIASIAPSYVSEFNGLKEGAIIKAIKKIGFDEVSETALGAEVVSFHCRELLQKNNKNFYISSACPSVVELVHKYYPDYVSNITPFHSPMETHGTLLKQMQNDAKIVFFSPCVAKKTETDQADSFVDVSLTFKDLKDWFDQEGVVVDEISEGASESFYPQNAASASMYPIDGGMVNSIKHGVGITDFTFMSFSGIGNIKNVLKGIDNLQTDKPIFLELLACEGGCINGPGSSNDESLAQKRYTMLTQSNNEAFKSKSLSKISISHTFNVTPIKINEYSENDIVDVLRSIGKQSKSDELNCGGCGYDSCRDFVLACLNKKAEQNMCVSYMKKVAHDKATTLLHKMPSGVVMVGEDLKIIESNKNFAKILGDDIESIYDFNPGLVGADLTKVISFHKLFGSVLANGENILERDVRENGKLFHVSIFSVQKHKVVCGLFRDMHAPEVQRDEVVKRTKSVIQQNLSTVQQIAYLLGENASRTEAMLNTIVDSYDTENE